MNNTSPVNTILLIIILLALVGGGIWWYENYGKAESNDAGLEINIGGGEQE